MPPNPIRDDEVNGHRHHEHRKIFIVCILCEDVEDLQLTGDENTTNKCTGSKSEFEEKGRRRRKTHRDARERKEGAEQNSVTADEEKEE